MFCFFIFRFFVIQVFVPLSKDFAVELAMADINNRKRRIVLSSSFKDLSSTALHAKLPLSMMKRDIWVNLCFDLLSFMNEMFTNQVFKALEEFTISGRFCSCILIDFSSSRLPLVVLTSHYENMRM